MNRTLIAAAVAAVFGLPLAAAVAEDKASSGATSSGAEQMFKALDKNNDASISREEAKGTPHDKDFATLDKDGDGKLSREEHAAAPEHAGESASGGATGAPGKGSSSGGGSKY